MEDGLLASSSNSQNKEKIINLTKAFEDACGHCIAMGMSYSDFWDGDPEMVSYVRSAYELDKQRRNEGYWIQGLYIYDALLRLWPAMRFGSKVKPKPYREEPIPISKKQEENIEVSKAKARMERNRAYMIGFTTNFNQRFKDKEKG